MPLIRGMLRQHASTLMTVIRLFDVFLVALSVLLISRWHFQSWEMPPTHLQSVLLGLLLVFLIFPLFSLYRAWRGESIWSEVRSVSFAWGAVFLILLVVSQLSKSYFAFQQSWAIAWFFTAGGLLATSRFALRLLLRWFRSRGFNFRNIVIVGAGRLGQQISEQLQTASWTGFNIVGFFDDNPDLVGKSVNGIPVQGSIEEVTQTFGDKHVDQVWIALPLRSETRIRSVLHQLRHSTVEIRLIPDIFSFQLLNHSLSDVAGIPVLDLSTSPMSGTNRIIKAVEDRVLASLIVFILSPLLLLIALGVRKSSPGPIFFKQRRHGWNGKPVEIWKFRTMYLHPEEFVQATKNDERITPFGRFLRKTSLDELPQFINVLQGRMSIVGPRPHPLMLNEEFKNMVPQYMQRHRVKPGITGWAQVNGWRGETDTISKMEKRVEHDLYYIENWSLWFDIKIILMTLFTGFTHKNAY